MNSKINKRQEVELLKNVWSGIPASTADEPLLTDSAIADKVLHIFHPGSFFYGWFDTRKADFEYMSPGIADVMGYAPHEFGFNTLIKATHPDDLPYYLHFEKQAVEFFSELPADKLTKYKFTHDQRVQHKNGHYVRLLAQVVPVHFFPEGGARTLSIYTGIDHMKESGKPRLSFIGLEGEPSFYNVDLGSDFKRINSVFTKREQEVLKYTVEGCTSSQTAEWLHISKFTVDTHRKNILAKAKSRNVTELIAKAINEGWV